MSEISGWINRMAGRSGEPVRHRPCRPPAPRTTNWYSCSSSNGATFSRAHARATGTVRDVVKLSNRRLGALCSFTASMGTSYDFELAVLIPGDAAPHYDRGQGHPKIQWAEGQWFPIGLNGPVDGGGSRGLLAGASHTRPMRFFIALHLSFSLPTVPFRTHTASPTHAPEPWLT
eukprot:CAMPEP_0182525636 /NCGR_PEP_ID=MMETSP1323-20130603/2621_1 /TAXON_ID=236787 /ORGANISM="Florenciella parvula, Strain RCC1693" /LENGTH=173 /DNA_ID=CAMNT_0024734371 /DNA_START=59 /DNA_END=581 /DNA_ORIENTATION=+